MYLICKPILEPTLSDRQHGFRPRKSTITNLLESYHLIYKTLGKRTHIDMVTIDMSKAFDTIDRSILITKLKAKGIKEPLINSIEYILKHKKQQVLIRDCKSNPLPVTSGVPQGSVLSPLLFAAFIDDLLSSVHYAYTISYADDIKIISESSKDLQNEIDRIYNWATCNHMDINVVKCESIHCGPKNPKAIYYINNSAIPQVSNLRDLGLQIDDRLTFREHTVKTRQKCLRIIGLIFRIIHVRDAEAYLLLYKTCVLPIIEYCAIIYSLVSHSNINFLEGIQRKFTTPLF